MDAKENLYRALAGLAYAIAMCDGSLQASEKAAFLKTISEDLGEDYWIAESRFELLENETTPSIESAYNNTLFVIRRNKMAFDEAIKKRYMRVIKDVAEAYAGTEDAEEFIIERFKMDLREMGL